MCAFLLYRLPREKGSKGSISLKNHELERRRQALAAVGRQGKLGRCASSGEGRRRKGDELGQFPQILGGGR